MIVLAVDTALGACQAALVRDGDTLAARSEAMDRGHQERLAPMAAELFAEAGLKPAAVDRVAVTLGPGAFTGLRVGIAFSKGFVLGLRRPLIGIGTLEALAAGSSGRAAAVIAAPHGRVYWQVFENGRALTPPALMDIEVAQAACARFAVDRLIGPGVDSLAFFTERDPRLAPDPLALALLAAAAPEPASPPQPLYLREPDAKTVAERAALKAAAAP